MEARITAESKPAYFFSLCPDNCIRNCFSPGTRIAQAQEAHFETNCILEKVVFFKMHCSLWTILSIFLSNEYMFFELQLLYFHSTYLYKCSRGNNYWNSAKKFIKFRL